MSVESNAHLQGLDEVLARRASGAKATDTSSRPLASADQLVEVPLELLDDSPDQPRKYVDPEYIDSLAESIRTKGLLNAIAVRPVAGRFQVIGGHCRRDAFKLLNSTGAQGARNSWATIPAVVKQVGDLEAALLCFSENITREDLSPSEEGEGYAALMRKYGIGSAKELAAKLSVDEARITRRLRLARAPQIIRDGLTRGMKVPVEGEVEEGGPRRETRRLSMDAAIEFVKLYERHLTKKYAGVKPDGTPAADPKLAALVERCLTEGWSREKVRTFVDRTIAGKPVPVDDESTKKSAASADRGVAWTDGDRFIVALGRARAASSEEKSAILEQLRAALNTGSERA